MQPVASVQELLQGVQKIKQIGDRFATNLFASPSVIQSWIDRSDLFMSSSKNCLLLVRHDRNFVRLYYAAGSANALEGALENFESQSSNDVTITDLLGKDRELPNLVQPFIRQKFSNYKQLIRMHNIPDDRFRSMYHDFPVEDVLYAQKEDVPEISSFLEGELDPYAEQIPTGEEIAEACAGQNVLVVKKNRKICGILIFRRQAMSALLKYWFVSNEVRSQGIGSQLIKSMFEICKDVRRYLLWVFLDNQNAIQKYQHYGFTREGLVDQIMIRR